VAVRCGLTGRSRLGVAEVKKESKLVELMRSKAERVAQFTEQSEVNLCQNGGQLEVAVLDLSNGQRKTPLPHKAMPTRDYCLEF
jgi:hypothetical protein